MAKEVDKEVVEELAVNVKGNMCKSRQTMNTCHTEMVLAFEEYHPHRKFSQIQSFKNNLNALFQWQATVKEEKRFC